jgi:hypothetical protein
MAVRYELNLSPHLHHKVYEVEQEEAASILMMLQCGYKPYNYSDLDQSSYFAKSSSSFGFSPSQMQTQHSNNGHSNYPMCMNCGTRNSPAWRNGGTMDNGKKRLLCNACGLRWRREKQ